MSDPDRSDAPPPGPDTGPDPVPGPTPGPPPSPPPGWSAPTPPPATYGYPAPVNPADSRNWGMAGHLSALVTLLGIPSFVGPLVVWLVRRNQDPFAAEHARESLNFNLSVLIYVIVGGIAAVILTVVTVGIGLIVIVPAALVAMILWLVWTIQGAMAASRGEAYRYPVTIRMVS
jgi:uncharacterized protein